MCTVLGGLLGNVLSLSSFTHAHKRKEAAVAEGWRQSWNVDGLDVLQNAFGMHFLAFVILEAALIRIFKEQKPEHSLKWTETMKTNRLECNPTPVPPHCENSELKRVGFFLLFICLPACACVRQFYLNQMSLFGPSGVIINVVYLLHVSPT